MFIQARFIMRGKVAVDNESTGDLSGVTTS